MNTSTTSNKKNYAGRFICIAILIYSGTTGCSQHAAAQVSNNNSAERMYRYLSTVTSGPAYKYNITSFIGKYMPEGAVQLSDSEAAQMDRSARLLQATSDGFAFKARLIRAQITEQLQASIIRQMALQADSLENLSANFQLEASENAGNALKRQYEMNEKRINAMQQGASSYPTDELTLANLLEREALLYYTKAVQEYNKVSNSGFVYLSQSITDGANKHLEAALLKQQSAVNVYLSLYNNTSKEVAMKIDSILTPLSPVMPNAGNIIFTIEVGAFTGVVPEESAKELSKIEGLGLAAHNEKNGKTIYTVGEYTSFTSADLLSRELLQDGFKNATVVTYTGNGKYSSPFEGIALK